MLTTFSSYFSKIKQQFFRTVENARSSCKRPLEEISDDEETSVRHPYRPLRKKACTTRDELLPPVKRAVPMKPSLHWKPRSPPSLASIKEDEPDLIEIAPAPTVDRKSYMMPKATDVMEASSRQPHIRTTPSVRLLSPDSIPSTSRRIIPPRLSSDRTTLNASKNVTARKKTGSWPRNCLGGSNYSDSNKKPLSLSLNKWKPTTITESIRIEEKKKYQQLLQHCTLSQSPSSLSPSHSVSQVSSSSSRSPSPVMCDVRWSRQSSIESVQSDSGSENTSPIFFSNTSKIMRKEVKSKHQNQPAAHHKSTRPKIPLSDITMRKEFMNSKKKDKMGESVIRSGSLCAGDEEELSMGQVIRQRHTEKGKSAAIPVIDLCQSDSDSSGNTKDSESDSIEIVDEFSHNRRKSKLLKDLYDGKWMEAKQDEFSSLDLKAKSKTVDDEEIQSERTKRVNVLHEKVQNRLKRLDIISAMSQKPRVITRPVKKQTFTPLTPEMQDEIEAALVPHPKSEVLIHKFNIKITRWDIATLDNLNWLNDEVVNFYFNLIMDRSLRNKRLPRVYVFSTFFYPRLYQSGYKSVSRWTKKVDIFSYDILLIPIHLDVHWCMATVDFKKRCITYYDSMLGDNPECLQILLEYLKAEYLDKKKMSYKTTAWKLECAKDIPEQMNGSDCGMFACKFAEFNSRLAPLDFSQEDMPYFRQRTVYEIIKGELLEG